MFQSYLVLLVTSFMLSGHPHLQQLVALVWIFWAVCMLWMGCKQTPLHEKKAHFIWMAQLPGMVAVLASVISQVTGRLGEWGDGVLEVWVHPFMPFLELLPPVDWGPWSDVYLVSCVLPFAISLFGIIVLRILAKQVHSNLSASEVHPRK